MKIYVEAVEALMKKRERGVKMGMNSSPKFMVFSLL